jgi:hypothetical protein
MAPAVYPGWTVRVYYNSSVPLPVLYELRGLDVEVVDMSSSPLPAMQWRFLPMDDAEVSHFIVRDADSRLSVRERDAVKEWMQSGRAFHMMRDHPHHRLQFMGGMWGATGGAVPEMGTKIRDFNRGGRFSNAWGKEQNFLNAVLTRFLNANNSLNHDAFYCERRFVGLTLGFPTARLTEDHVGSIYGAGNHRLTGCPSTSADCKSPLSCRRSPANTFG